MKKKFQIPNSKLQQAGQPGGRNLLGFTLVEILLAVAVFTLVVTLASSLYIQSFRESRRASAQNQIYEDARYVLSLIAQEVRSGMVDYDEYYYQNVVLHAPGLSFTPMQNFGQGYGRYYGAFFNPGTDESLGFDCNDGERNKRGCTPIRGTVDKNTGSNPFTGKTGAADENAFCGRLGGTSNVGRCGTDTGTTPLKPLPPQSELYLINEDGTQKTILAREKIGEVAAAGSEPVKGLYALSLLRLKGVDANNDGLMETFVCADDFQCRGGDEFDVAGSGLTHGDGNCGASSVTPKPADLPRSRVEELEAFDSEKPEGDTCDTKSGGFSRDFVPISPFRVSISKLDFYITPDENPHYAFAENGAQRQPEVTIVLTVEPNPEQTGTAEKFDPVTFIQTVTAGVLLPIPAPLLVESL